MAGRRRLWGWLFAAGLAWHASASSAAPPGLLPPGIRPPADRSAVETQAAPYGARQVEPVADATAEPGAAAIRTLEFTVDPALEARVRGVLLRHGIALGHVVLMDPESGELFAYVSSDPERFPATRAYPTASLMKVVTAAAVLRHAPEVAERDCRWQGSPYELREAHLERRPESGTPASVAARAHAPVQAPARPGGGGHEEGSESAGTALGGDAAWDRSFRRALAISNNQCFARFAVHDLGEEALRAEIDRVGLVEAPGARHAQGSVDPIEAPLDLGNLGSGLAGSTISPLGAVRLAGLLATGELVAPRWIARVSDRDGLPVAAFEAPAPRRVWTPETAASLRDLLRSVTEVGTARRAFHDEDGSARLGPVDVAGKTGTLRGEDPSGLYQWFIGVAPEREPRIAIAALVVHPDGTRGASASEIAAATLEEVFCDARGGCAAERAELLHARRAGREREIARLLREAAEAAEAEAAEAAASAAVQPLDEPLRPRGKDSVRLPRRLLRDRVRGEVVLRLELDPDGAVVGATVDASDLPPAFGEFLVEEVSGWRFTPPRRAGRPVSTTARLRVPIQVD